MAVHETDICIIGGGITSAMLAERLVRAAPGRAHRGRRSGQVDLRRAEPRPVSPARDRLRRASVARRLHRGSAGQRHHLDDDGGRRAGAALGRRVQSLLRGGPAAASRCTAWRPTGRSSGRSSSSYYCEAERRLNVSGEPSPHPEDRRSAPYPQGPIPLSYNLQTLKTWAEQSGITFSPLPMARNLTPFGGRGSCCVYDTCGEVCPSGARYSPDFTFKQLIAPKKIVLHDRTLVRRLIARRQAARRSSRRRRCIRIVRTIRSSTAPKTFVVASGYCWSSHLLLLSENTRFPNGLANSSGLVGRYMNGHKFIQATANIDDQTFPGQNMTHSLISRQYFRCRDRQAVRPARHARLGELGRPRSAAARRRTASCCSATS